MRRKLSRPILIGILGAGLVSAASAHHPILGKFDQDDSRTLEGIVTKVDWRNPHAHVFMNIVEGGETFNWAVELESPAELQLSGWSRETLVPGDAIVVDGMLA
ncbi:MAG TPA: DUF6152 family protein, partial [Gammaproteobacteria bacterium]|nr:DUF6152 family protein [Gammaproteobacteria bacterium]